MPIGNITQTMSTISPPPHRGVDVQTVFVNKQEDFQDHLADITIDELNTLKDQLNTRIGEINSTATTMNGYADTASAGASTATTKAGEASTSASGALTSRNQAETFKNNASASATKASQWADNNYNVEVETGRYSAKHWSTVAENAVGDTVKLTGNQTIAEVKTFTSSPIVPTPTTDFQVATKKYVDGKYSGFKNYIINGKKVVNQRVSTSTDNSYNQDRWYKAGNNWFQGVEGDNNLINGKTYTLSWAGNATASYYVGNATSSTINAQTFTSITNGGSFTLTISAGQNLWIKFISDATGSTFNFVQLEEGLVATPFENRPYTLELMLCKRYYRKSFGYETAPTQGSSPTTFAEAHQAIVLPAVHRGSSASSNPPCALVFDVEMRVAPAVYKYGNSDGFWFFRDSLVGGVYSDVLTINATKNGLIVVNDVSATYDGITIGHYVANAEL